VFAGGVRDGLRAMAVVWTRRLALSPWANARRIVGAATPGVSMTNTLPGFIVVSPVLVSTA